MIDRMMAIAGNVTKIKQTEEKWKYGKHLSSVWIKAYLAATVTLK